MAARIGEATRIDETKFVAYGTTVRVFQQHAQAMPNTAQRALSVDEMLEGDKESALIRAELLRVNDDLYAHLRDVHLAEQQDTGGAWVWPNRRPHGVHAISVRRVAISYTDDAGVNSGRSHTQYQHSEPPCSPQKATSSTSRRP